MVIFYAVVQDFHVFVTEHLVVEFLDDDAWKHFFAIPMDRSSLTAREFAQSDFSGLVPVSCPTLQVLEKNNQMSVKLICERTMVFISGLTNRFCPSKRHFDVWEGGVS